MYYEIDGMQKVFAIFIAFDWWVGATSLS